MNAPAASSLDLLEAEFPEWKFSVTLHGRIWSAERWWDEGRTRRYIIAGSGAELLAKLRENGEQ